MKLIEIIVTPNGETTVQTKGYAGSDCLAASKFLEQALGATFADTKTSEYFQVAAAEQEIHA